MDFSWIVPVLAMATLLIVCVYALMSKKAVEDRMDDPSAPRSTLAKDGPQGGVAVIDPEVAMRRQHEADPYAARPATPYASRTAEPLAEGPRPVEPYARPR